MKQNDRADNSTEEGQALTLSIRVQVPIRPKTAAMAE